MKKLSDAAEALHGYLLREESFEKLQQLRNQLFLMAGVIVAATQAEEDEPLELQRSALGQCFESFGLQVEEVLSGARWGGRSVGKALDDRHSPLKSASGLRRDDGGGS